MRRTAMPLAVGLVDFDGNGFDDLAVGAPGETVGSAREAGALTILRGLELNGVPSSGQQFTQGRITGGQPELLDNFGAALG